MEKRRGLVGYFDEFDEVSDFVEHTANLRCVLQHNRHTHAGDAEGNHRIFLLVWAVDCAFDLGDFQLCHDNMEIFERRVREGRESGVSISY